MQAGIHSAPRLAICKTVRSCTGGGSGRCSFANSVMRAATFSGLILGVRHGVLACLVVASAASSLGGGSGSASASSFSALISLASKNLSVYIRVTCTQCASIKALSLLKVFRTADSGRPVYCSVPANDYRYITADSLLHATMSRAVNITSMLQGTRCCPVSQNSNFEYLSSSQRATKGCAPLQ